MLCFYANRQLKHKPTQNTHMRSVRITIHYLSGIDDDEALLRHVPWNGEMLLLFENTNKYTYTCMCTLGKLCAEYPTETSV